MKEAFIFQSRFLREHLALAHQLPGLRRGEAEAVGNEVLEGVEAEAPVDPRAAHRAEQARLEDAEGKMEPAQVSQERIEGRERREARRCGRAPGRRVRGEGLLSRRDPSGRPPGR
jgi:hypothetical protein